MVYILSKVAHLQTHKDESATHSRLWKPWDVLVFFLNQALFFKEWAWRGLSSLLVSSWSNASRTKPSFDVDIHKEIGVSNNREPPSNPHENDQNTNTWAWMAYLHMISTKPTAVSTTPSWTRIEKKVCFSTGLSKTWGKNHGIKPIKTQTIRILSYSLLVAGSWAVGRSKRRPLAHNPRRAPHDSPRWGRSEASWKATRKATASLKNRGKIMKLYETIFHFVFEVICKLHPFYKAIEKNQSSRNHCLMIAHPCFGHTIVTIWTHKLLAIIVNIHVSYFLFILILVIFFFCIHGRTSKLFKSFLNILVWEYQFKFAFCLPNIYIVHTSIVICNYTHMIKTRFLSFLIKLI